MQKLLIIEHLGVLYSNRWLTQCIPQRVHQQSEEEVLSVVRAHWQWCCHREDTQWGGQGGMSVPTGRSLPRPWSKKGPNWTGLYLLCVEVPVHWNVLTDILLSSITWMSCWPESGWPALTLWTPSVWQWRTISMTLTRSRSPSIR